MTLLDIDRRLSEAMSALRFSDPVAYVYNPLQYAKEPHEAYLSLAGNAPRDVLFVGMNPGPFGMAQTGVPFGDIGRVTGYLGIRGAVTSPPETHPKRPVEGFACSRGEVSGQRFWGWVQKRFPKAEQFFERAFVANYCPLLFLEASGKNLTPDKLRKAERDAILGPCDEALRAVVQTLRPRWVLGIGKFAEARAKAALSSSAFPAEEVPKIGVILHPSPASPAANRGWEPAVEKQLAAQNLRFFLT